MESTGNIRLEALVSKYLTSKCEFDTFPQQLRQTQFKVSVFEFLPEVWVSDDQYYMEAVFTREAYNDFKKMHAGQKLSKLKDKMILIKRWGLVAKEVDSEEVYTSFMNIKVQLVIEQFQPLVHENLSSVQTRKFENLFEESKEVREIIKSIKHNHYKNSLKKVPNAQALNFNATKVQNTYDLSYDSIFKSNYTEPTHDTDSDDQKSLRAYLEKDLKTYKIVDIFQLLSNELKPETLQEVKEKCQIWSFDNIQKTKDREATKQALDFIQINREIPENKDTLIKKNKKEAREKENAADLEIEKIEKVSKKQALTEVDIFEGRNAPLPKQEQAKVYNHPTPQKHKGYDQSVLKNKLLMLLNPKLGNRPSFNESEQKKTYSTEDLIQNRAVPFLSFGKSDHRQEAMSQFITYNRLDDEEEQTETEKDEDEEMLEQRRLGVLNNFKMNIYMFQKFLKWQRFNQVSRTPIIDLANAKKEEENELEQEKQMVTEKELIQEDFEQEEEDEVMDKVEKIQSEEEEDEDEENQYIRRSSRSKKPILREEYDGMDIQDPEEYEPDEKEATSVKQVPKKKGFQTMLDDDVNDDSSKQLDEEYESLYEEGDPGENVELENLEDLIKREKLEISQLVQSKTKKMLESSDEESSSEEQHSLQKMSPQKQLPSTVKKQQLLEIPEEKAKILESPKGFKNQSPQKQSPQKQSPQKQSPQKQSPQKHSPKKCSPQKYIEDSEEEIILNKKSQNIKRQRRAFEDDSSEEYMQSPNPETPKNTYNLYEDAGTTGTNNLKSSSQQSSQEEEVQQIQKSKFEELLSSSQRKAPSPIAMKKEAPSDFGLGMGEKSIIKLGEKRAGYEIDNRQASRYKDSDSDVVVPEHNDGEMSPTYSIAPDPEARQEAPKEKFAFYEGQAEELKPSLGGTPEWHRSCENSERMSSGPTLNQQLIVERMRKLEEENQKLRKEMQQDFVRRQERSQEKLIKKEQKRRRREEKEQLKRMQLLEAKQQMKLQLKGLLGKH